MSTITMTQWKRRTSFYCFILVACFAIFVLPFFFPPPYLHGVSAANVAGFNNKVASLAAAILGAIVFLGALKQSWGGVRPEIGEQSPLPPYLVVATVAIFGTLLTLICVLVARSHLLYLYDAGYFIHQIRMHADYTRKLYEQIEFPYGPTIFYGPIAMRWVLSPFQTSLATAYYTTLVLEHLVGLSLVAYVINGLPMLQKWKKLLFLLCAVGSLQACLGLNYTFFRFIVGPSFLVLAARLKTPLGVASAYFIGALVSLSISPEIALAFDVAATSSGAYQSVTRGRTWLLTTVAPALGSATLLFLMDRSYLLMLKLFARGLLNLVVEPLPHTLIFLFALLWLVPCTLARSFNQRRKEAPLLGALYIFSVVLLPAAFGREDPIHVYYNGLMIFFLSMVSISTFRLREQTVWAICISLFFLWTPYLNAKIWRAEWSEAIPYGIFHYKPVGLKRAVVTFVRTGSLSIAEQSITRVYEDRSFEIVSLQKIVGRDQIATPLQLPLYIEEQLTQAGQYTPSRYAYMVAVLDADAEERAIRELNASKWLLLPRGARVRATEPLDATGFVMGFQITYPARHEPFVVGEQFTKNIALNWQSHSIIGNFELYRHL